MTDDTDQLLIREYARNDSDQAFGELVRRHVDLVYATALRVLRDSNPCDAARVHHLGAACRSIAESNCADRLAARNRAKLCRQHRSRWGAAAPAWTGSSHYEFLRFNRHGRLVEGNSTSFGRGAGSI